MCQLSSLKTSPGLVSLPGSVQLLHKITNAKTVGAVGINRFKILVTGSIDMWHHPKYYKELRKRNKLDQAISHANSTRGPSDVRPDPGLKLDVPAPAGPSVKPQASSAKLQAQLEATSSKQK